MLQNIRDKSSGWIAKLILGLIIAIMALFGLEQYLTPKVENYAAKVTVPGNFLGMGEQSIEISVTEFRRRFDQTRQLQRQQQGDAFDAAAFETAINKRKILEQMIDEASLRMGAKQAGVQVTNAMVQQAILQIESFKVGGKFDSQTYQLALQQQGYTPAYFDSLVRDDLLTKFIASEYIATAIASEAETLQLIQLAEQKRSVDFFDIPPPALNLNATEAELSAWYNNHKSEYKTQETASIEYVELDNTAAQTSTVVDESVLRQQYQQQIAMYSEPEQRVASHILLAVAESASASADSAAKAKAVALAKQLQSNPNAFAESARTQSDDTASKDVGGDLGPVEKGIYGDAFDKVFFALKPGQISEPVRLPDGWHILQYRELIAGAVKPFEQVRAEIESNYLSSEKERAFNDAANKMVNAISENASSLEPAAKAVNKPLMRSSAFTRQAGEGVAALAQIRKAAFSEEVLSEGRVSDLVEIEPNHVVMLRVVEHKPSVILPLATVKEQVRYAFVQDRAEKLALVQAKALLARAKKGETLAALAKASGQELKPANGFGRRSPVPQLQAVIDEAFRLSRPTATNAGGIGYAKSADGRYVLMQVRLVESPSNDLVDAASRASAVKTIGQMRGDQQASELIKALRKSYVISVAEDRL